MLKIVDLVSTRDGEAVFAPVAFECGAGQSVEIVGPNGSGKTTLLRTLAGLHSQYAGTYQFGSDEAPVYPLYQGHRIGLDESLSALDNLGWFAALVGQKIAQKDTVDVLARVGALRFAQTPVGQLSQGQQRRVTMARWLQSDARLWLLDEPLTALDENAQTLLVELIDEAVAAGKTVLYATHAGLPVRDKSMLAITAMSQYSGVGDFG
ncbi:MAG: heme ABC exporter ATP-binding protein CcmA [Pseudomonadales bacterium]|nr:heme ABC exporter ATP-binding protein CcmA [Pseudomonadales bacterium]